MTRQISINFEHPHAADTSAAAAASIAPRLPALCRQVLDFIVACGEHGCTDEEIFSGTGLSESTCRPRRVELRDSGYVIDSGRRRKTSSGRNSAVWVAAGQPLHEDRATTSDRSFDIDGARDAEPAAERFITQAQRGAAAAALPHAAFECESCGFDQYVDVPIHGGESRRRDCARCRRTVGFPLWYGRVVSGART